MRNEVAPKIVQAQRSVQAVLTAEQKATRAKALKEAKAAGKQGKELWQAAEASVDLTDEQKAEQARHRKQLNAIYRETRTQIIKLLTPEQRQALKEKAKKASSGNK